MTEEDALPSPPRPPRPTVARLYANTLRLTAQQHGLEDRRDDAALDLAQQAQIDALEARVARLEAALAKLMK